MAILMYLSELTPSKQCINYFGRGQCQLNLHNHLLSFFAKSLCYELEPPSELCQGERN